MLSEDRIPAYVEVEATVLGAVILNNALLDEARAALSEEDFHLVSHRSIWAAMASLADQGMDIDLATLHADLLQRGELEAVGGATRLARLIDGVPRTDRIDGYLRILHKAARDRRLLGLLHAETERLLTGEADWYASAERVSAEIDRLRQSADTTRRGYYRSLDDFFGEPLSEAEELLVGLHRGEVVELQAVTNIGKTTLMLNLCLAAAAGQACPPLLPAAGPPRRVLYLDFETPPARLRADLRTMLGEVADPDLARRNFLVSADEVLGGAAFNLSRREHLAEVARRVRAEQVDIVVVDTVTAGFELQDENSNAEVTRRVMNPLNRLAREGGCLVFFTHHIGKQSEGPSGVAAYRGRGASAFGGRARDVLSLTPRPELGEGYVALSSVKPKGRRIEETVLRLNYRTRWFEAVARPVAVQAGPPTAQEIAEYVARHPATTEQLREHFSDRASAATVSMRVAEAARLGLIEKPTRQSPWLVCDDDRELVYSSNTIGGRRLDEFSDVSL